MLLVVFVVSAQEIEDCRRFIFDADSHAANSCSSLSANSLCNGFPNVRVQGLDEDERMGRRRRHEDAQGLSGSNHPNGDSRLAGPGR